MKRILLVEDDADLIDGLEYAFRKNGFEPVLARSEREALERVSEGRYDLLLLDVTLGDGSGFNVCREARKTSSVPIVFLTASDGETSVVKGLDIGGDDYVTKPFRLTELFARVNAVLRRTRPETTRESVLISNGISLNVPERQATIGNERLELTAAEFRLLRLFMENKNAVLERDRILSLLWDSSGAFIDDNTLSVHVNRLRGKIERDPSCPTSLVTVRGVGYRWNDLPPDGGHGGGMRR